MGYGLDEDQEELEEREPTKDESLAIETFDYDVDEFFALTHTMQRQKIWMAKRCREVKQHRSK